MAGTAARAAHLARRRQPDLLIVDISMAAETAARLRKRVQPTAEGPVLIVTAYTDLEIAAQAIPADVAAYAIKPVLPGTLLPLLEVTFARLAEMRALRGELEALRTKLRRQHVVARAKRFLMESQDLTEAEAYLRLREQSMEGRLPMHEIAAAVLAQAPTTNEVARRPYDDIVDLSA
jgi:response regulator NasT